ncbi:MAG: RagB/SusD family nutrient uptake outer membrane protein [Mangrovibacterium sp.]
MKKILFLYVFVTGICTLFTSCNEMDVFPKGEISNESFWQNEDDVKMAVAGTYTFLRANHLAAGAYKLEGATDNGWVPQPGSVIQEMQIGSSYSPLEHFESVGGNILLELFGQCYKGIAACNDFFKFFPSVVAKINIPAGRAAVYEAEVRFLRAYFYFQLVQKYRDIPLYKESIESIEASKIKQSPASEVYAFIHEDLDFAIRNLPDQAYSDGHVVKGTAQALEARVSLFQEDWTKVETLTRAIIESGKFSLTDNYNKLFIKREGQKNNPELMFTTLYLKGSVENDMELNFGIYPQLLPLANLVNSYDINDNRRKEWFSNVADNIYVNPFGDQIVLQSSALTGWLFTKLFDKNSQAFYTTGMYDYHTENDIVLIRYADVYLMYIEAMVEKGGGTTTDALAIQCMNKIRNRAGISEMNVISRDELRLERRRELASEGLRYFDMVRWRIAETVMNGLQVPTGVGKFLSHFYTWPFPQSEIDLNPQLDQKNGY